MVVRSLCRPQYHKSTPKGTPTILARIGVACGKVAFDNKSFNISEMRQDSTEVAIKDQ